MKTNLFISPYEDSNAVRRLELEKCMRLNFQAGYDKIYLLIEQKDADYIQTFIAQNQFNDVIIEVVDQRPPFQKYIDKANTLGEEDINIVCNSDIYVLPEDLQMIKDLPWQKYPNLFVSLARWDETAYGNFILLDRQDTSDTFIWRGHSLVERAYCPLGYPGVDHAVPFLFNEKGYKVVNPSRTIKTRHLHLSRVINYRLDSKPDGAVDATKVCPPPYFFHPPIFVEQI